MKNKKEYKNWTVDVGYSDIQALAVRDADGLHDIAMGEDGKYSAHIVTNWFKYEIPNHYYPCFTANKWMWVYDDEGVVLKVYNAERIEIYRAGLRGLLFNIVGEDYAVEEVY